MAVKIWSVHETAHHCSITEPGRLTVRAIVRCLLFEAERIYEVAKTVEDLKTDFEAFRAKVLARVDALQAAVDAATQNGAEVPPGVQSQIDALANEIETDTANDANEPAPAEDGGTPTV